MPLEENRPETVPVTTERDVVTVRERVRAMARQLGFGVVDETKIVTASSEISRNILTHAGHGEARLEVVFESGRHGVRAEFTDSGPGIADIELAMRDGFSTVGSLGMGLPGTKRLVDRFEIETKPGAGTRVVLLKWKR